MTREFFTIGSRVRVGKAEGGDPPSGKIGIIVGKNQREGRWAVMIEGFDGHTCGSHCPRGNGWWLYEFEMSLYALTEEELKMADFLTKVHSYLHRELS